MGKYLMGIISWLPPDEKLRAERREAHRKQIELVRDILPDVHIRIVAQCYREDEYIDDPNISYRKSDTPITMSAGRNLLLDLLYNSDFDWMILADDDLFIYEHYDYKEFFDAMAEGRFNSEIDWILPFNPAHDGFNKYVVDDELFQTHFKFGALRIPYDFPNIQFIKNLKKYHGKTMWYDEDLCPEKELCANEDLEFSLRMIREGFRGYVNYSIVKKDFGVWKSSIGTIEKGYSKEERKETQRIRRDHLISMFPELYRRSNGNIVWKDFIQRYNRSGKVLYIPRGEGKIIKDPKKQTLF